MRLVGTAASVLRLLPGQRCRVCFERCHFKKKRQQLATPRPCHFSELHRNVADVCGLQI
jgi:hypothetical protein